MRYLLFFLIIAGFLNCDGRRGKLQKFRSDSNHLSQFFNPKSTDIYVPSEAVEIKTDTIIERKFYVSIRNYSVENDPILVTSTTSSHNAIYQFHKRFKSEVAVCYEDEDIFNAQLQLDNFADFSTDAFWRDATFEHVWVNEDLSNKEQLHINISIVNPIDKAYRLYEMTLSPNGLQNISLLDKSA